MASENLCPPGRPPGSIDALLRRAERLAGLTLGDLAEAANLPVPVDFRRHKGWSGQLLELFLGADAGSKPTQDFPALGVELKTIPVDSLGRPLETTYVCYAPLTGITGLTWERSNLYNKLRQVLWVPIQGERDIPPAQRQIGCAFLWQPDEIAMAPLRQDWEEIMDRIALGDVENISARHGQALQLRPKAADGSKLTDAIGKEGTLIKTRPRGFYLRKSFTQALLLQAFD